jgi:hypothetical protein
MQHNLKEGVPIYLDFRVHSLPHTSGRSESVHYAAPKQVYAKEKNAKQAALLTCKCNASMSCSQCQN